MSQSINFGNVSAVTFNGSTVAKVNLNGSQIWLGGYSSSFSSGSRNFPGSDKFGANQEKGFSVLNTGTLAGTLAPIGSRPANYEGYQIDEVLSHYWSNGQSAGTEVWIKIKGHHSSSFLGNVRINGRAMGGPNATVNENYSNLTGHTTKPSGNFTWYRWYNFSGLNSLLSPNPSTLQLG